MAKGYDPLFDPDFVGYNCRDSESEGEFGVIENVGDYAEEYYPSILDSLPDELKEKAVNSGLLTTPKATDKEFKEWAISSCEFFKKHGIKWIFVREEMPENDFESQFYYVSMPEEKVLCSFDYTFDDDEIRILVYATKGSCKHKPTLFAVPDQFSEDFSDDDIAEDEELYEEEEKNEGEAYWEDAWKGSEN